MTVYFWVSVCLAVYTTAEMQRDPVYLRQTQKRGQGWAGRLFDVVSHFVGAMVLLWVAGLILGLKWVE